MTREEVISLVDRVLGWPPEQQEMLTRIADHIEAQQAAIAPEDEETISAISEGLDQARRGEFASPDRVANVLRRFGSRSSDIRSERWAISNR